MLEAMRLGGSHRRSIALETRARSPILNEQAPEPDGRLLAVFRLLVSRHPQWAVRKPASGLYNCSGHVWASRRTAVYDQEAIDVILRDDGYTQIDDPAVGDLAIYASEAGDFLHVGEVVELRRLTSGDEVLPGIPYILSKMSDSAGEILHHYRDVPDGFVVAFWTERDRGHE